MKALRTGSLIALTLSVYAMLAIFLYEMLSKDFSLNGTFDLLVTLMTMIAIAAFFCIVFTFVTHKKSSLDPSLQKGLGNQIVVFKFALLPGMFLIAILLAYGFLILIALSFGMVFYFLTIPLIPVFFAAYGGVFVPFFLLVGVLLMLATSSFAISKILIYRKKYVLSTFATVVFVMLQLLPLADVISYPMINKFYNDLDKDASINRSK